MHAYFIVKLAHILSSTILFGTGIGTAFFMLRSYYSSNLEAKYYAATNTVLADFIFTTPAVIVQPLTGMWLILHMGYPWNAPWLILTYAIYFLVGCFWIPVVFIQIKLKNIVGDCLTKGVELPSRYYRLFKIWACLGVPAFISVIIIFYLMITKPS
jgi:uncharacterized membrane protein